MIIENKSGLLTHIERAGTFIVMLASASRAEREALSLHLAALRAAGHAVVADEVWRHGESTGDVCVTHYASCVACKRTVL